METWFSKLKWKPRSSCCEKNDLRDSVRSVIKIYFVFAKSCLSSFQLLQLVLVIEVQPSFNENFFRLFKLKCFLAGEDFLLKVSCLILIFKEKYTNKFAFLLNEKENLSDVARAESSTKFFRSSFPFLSLQSH